MLQSADDGLRETPAAALEPLQLAVVTPVGPSVTLINSIARLHDASVCAHRQPPPWPPPCDIAPEPRSQVDGLGVSPHTRPSTGPIVSFPQSTPRTTPRRRLTSDKRHDFGSRPGLSRKVCPATAAPFHLGPLASPASRERYSASAMVDGHAGRVCSSVDGP